MSESKTVNVHSSRWVPNIERTVRRELTKLQRQGWRVVGAVPKGERDAVIRVERD